MNQVCVNDWDQQYIETLLAPKLALIVDDDPETRQGARDAAEGYFLAIEEAADDAAAIVRLIKLPPLDFVFLDVRLPSTFHAVEVIHKISQAKVNARVIIMSSDSSQFSALETEYDLGVISFFRKGVDVKATFAKAYDQLGIRRKGFPPSVI